MHPIVQNVIVNPTRMPATADPMFPPCGQAVMDEPTIDLDVLFEENPPSPDEEPPVSEWAREAYGEEFSLPNPQGPDAEAFADDLVTKILDSRARQERIKAAWKPRLTREASREKGLLHTFGGWLGEFVKCRTKARKSVLLEVGTVGFRKKSQTLKILDPTGLALWALEKAPQMITCTLTNRDDDGTAQLMLNGGLPQGIKVTVRIPAGGIAFVRQMKYRSSVKIDYEVKQADALAWFQETGEVPFACELVPTHDDLYISEPADSKR